MENIDSIIKEKIDSLKTSIFKHEDKINEIKKTISNVNDKLKDSKDIIQKKELIDELIKIDVNQIQNAPINDVPTKDTIIVIEEEVSTDQREDMKQSINAFLETKEKELNRAIQILNDYKVDNEYNRKKIEDVSIKMENIESEISVLETDKINNAQKIDELRETYKDLNENDYALTVKEILDSTVQKYMDLKQTIDKAEQTGITDIYNTKYLTINKSIKDLEQIYTIYQTEFQKKFPSDKSYEPELEKHILFLRSKDDATINKLKLINFENGASLIPDTDIKNWYIDEFNYIFEAKDSNGKYPIYYLNMKQIQYCILPPFEEGISVWKHFYCDIDKYNPSVWNSKDIYCFLFQNLYNLKNSDDISDDLFIAKLIELRDSSDIEYKTFINPTPAIEVISLTSASSLSALPKSVLDTPIVPPAKSHKPVRTERPPNKNKATDNECQHLFLLFSFYKNLYDKLLNERLIYKTLESDDKLFFNKDNYKFKTLLITALNKITSTYKNDYKILNDYRNATYKLTKEENDRKLFLETAFSDKFGHPIINVINYINYKNIKDDDFKLLILSFQLFPKLLLNFKKINFIQLKEKASDKRIETIFDFFLDLDSMDFDQLEQADLNSTEKERITNLYSKTLIKDRQLMNKTKKITKIEAVKSSSVSAVNDENLILSISNNKQKLQSLDDGKNDYWAKFTKSAIIQDIIDNAKYDSIEQYLPKIFYENINFSVYNFILTNDKNNFFKTCIEKNAHLLKTFSKEFKLKEIKEDDRTKIYLIKLLSNCKYFMLNPFQNITKMNDRVFGVEFENNIKNESISLSIIQELKKNIFNTEMIDIYNKYRTILGNDKIYEFSDSNNPAVKSYLNDFLSGKDPEGKIFCAEILNRILSDDIDKLLDLKYSIDQIYFVFYMVEQIKYLYLSQTISTSIGRSDLTEDHFTDIDIKEKSIKDCYDLLFKNSKIIFVGFYFKLFDLNLQCKRDTLEKCVYKTFYYETVLYSLYLATQNITALSNSLELVETQHLLEFVYMEKCTFVPFKIYDNIQKNNGLDAIKTLNSILPILTKDFFLIKFNKDKKTKNILNETKKLIYDFEMGINSGGTEIDKQNFVKSNGNIDSSVIKFDFSTLSEKINFSKGKSLDTTITIPDLTDTLFTPNSILSYDKKLDLKEGLVYLTFLDPKNDILQNLVKLIDYVSKETNLNNISGIKKVSFNTSSFSNKDIHVFFTKDKTAWDKKRILTKNDNTADFSVIPEKIIVDDGKDSSYELVAEIACGYAKCVYIYESQILNETIVIGLFTYNLYLSDDKSETDKSSKEAYKKINFYDILYETQIADLISRQSLNKVIMKCYPYDIHQPNLGYDNGGFILTEAGMIDLERWIKSLLNITTTIIQRHDLITLTVLLLKQIDIMAQNGMMYVDLKLENIMYFLNSDAGKYSFKVKFIDLGSIIPLDMQLGKLFNRIVIQCSKNNVSAIFNNTQIPNLHKINQNIIDPSNLFKKKLFNENNKASPFILNKQDFDGDIVSACTASYKINIMFFIINLWVYLIIGNNYEGDLNDKEGELIPNIDLLMDNIERLKYYFRKDDKDPFSLTDDSEVKNIFKKIFNVCNNNDKKTGTDYYSQIDSLYNEFLNVFIAEFNKNLDIPFYIVGQKNILNDLIKMLKMVEVIGPSNNSYNTVFSLHEIYEVDDAKNALWKDDISKTIDNFKKNIVKDNLDKIFTVIELNEFYTNLSTQLIRINSIKKTKKKRFIPLAIENYITVHILSSIKNIIIDEFLRIKNYTYKAHVIYKNEDIKTIEDELSKSRGGVIGRIVGFKNKITNKEELKDVLKTYQDISKINSELKENYRNIKKLIILCKDATEVGNFFSYLIDKDVMDEIKKIYNLYKLFDIEILTKDRIDLTPQKEILFNITQAKKVGGRETYYIDNNTQNSYRKRRSDMDLIHLHYFASNFFIIIITVILVIIMIYFISKINCYNPYPKKIKYSKNIDNFNIVERI